MIISAILIQKNFRGYYIRNTLGKLIIKRHNAAIKI